MSLPISRFLFPLLLGMALGPAVLAETGEIRISGSGSGLAILQMLGKRFENEHPGARIQVLPSIGSSGGIRAVADGKIDIACSSRPLKPEEGGRGLLELPFARTPLVFVVQKSNPVSNLDLANILEMYEGRVTSWPSGEPIRLVLRPKTDTAHAQLSAISPEMAVAVEKAHTRPGAIVSMTDQDNADQMEKTRGCLGTSALGLILSESRSLKPLFFNGIQPTLQSLSRGTYPHVVHLTLVSAPERTAPATATFLKFLQSRPASEILRQYGYLPPAAPSGGKL